MKILSRINFGQRATVFSLVLLTSAVFSGPTKATVINPGPGAFPPDIFAISGATLLATTGVVAFTSTTGTLQGTFISAVFSDPSNTFGAGDLDFMYQVSNSAASTDSVGRVTAINFTGFSTDVGYTATGSTLGGGFVDGTVAPELVDRVAPGDSVGFSFNAPLTVLVGPGQTSTVLIIETNATQFTSGFANLIDGGVSTVNAFQPTVVPEPSATINVLLGISLLGLAGVRRTFKSC